MRDGWRTDKPPDECKKYLVQIRSPFGYMMICRWTNIYYFGHKVISNWHWELPQYTSQEDVIAWRELPEPYEPTRGKGYWEIYVISGIDGEGCRCSLCGNEGTPHYNFCPTCGAKMEGAHNENR